MFCDKISYENAKYQAYSGYEVKVSSCIEETRLVKSQQNQSFKKPEKPLNEDLLIFHFKINPCSINIQHNHKQCLYFHSNKDRRRPLMIQTNELCKIAQKHIAKQEYDFECIDGDNCPKCHNKVQQLYSNSKYKTKFCTHYPNNCQKCEYGVYCSFAHRQDEIRLQLLHHYEQDMDFFIFHYKTQWCPINYFGHDRRECVYAHNWQDYRRKPHCFNYTAVPCLNWNPDNFITKYQNQCKFQSSCDRCHGWKQLEYHPLSYKVKPCTAGLKCTKGKICPYYHNAQEKRKFSANIMTGFFIYHPRNRKLCETQQKTQSIKQLFGNDQLNKSQDLLSDCSSQSQQKDQRENDDQIENMVKKLYENEK